MMDYIKRSDAVGVLRNAQFEYTADEAVEFVLHIPAADVREVLFCKDCKWFKLSQYNTFGIHVCQKFSGVRGEHDFCSRGEKDD